MKKIISIILCLSLILGLAVAVSAAAGDKAAKVTSLDQLKDGDKIVIVSQDGTQAMGAQSGKFRSLAAVSAADGYVTLTADVAVLTVGITNKGYTFYDGGYLTATSSGNYLYTDEVASSASYWNVVIDAGIATISTNDGSNDRYLQYNASSTRFSGYKNTMADVCIYKIGGTYVPVDTKVVITPIADVVAAASGKWTVEGVVTHMFYSYGNYTIYVQDSTGGIVLYGDPGIDGLKAGDTVVCTGTWSPYNNLPELKIQTAELSKNTLTAKAKSVTIADLKNEMCELVTLTGSYTVTEVFDNDGAYTTPNITVVDASGNSVVLYSAPLTKNANDTWPIAVGDVVTSVTGVVSINKEEYRILPLSEAGIVYSTPSTPNPETPSETPTVTPTDAPTEAPTTKPTEPEKVGIADGTYVIYNPAYGMALSADYAGTYYNQGVAVTADGNVLTGFGATEIWTVKNNSDGTITISRAEGKLSQGDFSSMGFDLANDKWVLKSAGAGKYYVENVGTGKSIEWYAEKSNWSTYYVKDDTAPLFALQFCPVSVDGATATIPPTGDSVSIFVALMAISAVGIAVIGKKKEF